MPLENCERSASSDYVCLLRGLRTPNSIPDPSSCCTHQRQRVRHRAEARKTQVAPRSGLGHGSRSGHRQSATAVRLLRDVQSKQLQPIARVVRTVEREYRSSHRAQPSRDEIRYPSWQWARQQDAYTRRLRWPFLMQRSCRCGPGAHASARYAGCPAVVCQASRFCEVSYPSCPGSRNQSGCNHPASQSEIYSQVQPKSRIVQGRLVCWPYIFSQTAHSKLVLYYFEHNDVNGVDDPCILEFLTLTPTSFIYTHSLRDAANRFAR